MDNDALDRLRAQLRLHEGYRTKPYKCSSGKLTIGVGRNLDDVGLHDYEIGVMLENDIMEAEDSCQHQFGQEFFASLSEVRQRVLIDMMFNLGNARFAGFKNMITAVEAGNWTRAADEMVDSKWYRQVGTRGERLVKMMRTGKDYDG